MAPKPDSFFEIKKCRKCGAEVFGLKTLCKPCWDNQHTRKSMVWDGEAELELLRDACKTNFWMFFYYAFGAGLNPKGKAWIDPKIHKPIADWFQGHVMEWMEWKRKGLKRRKFLAALVHREVGKTTMLTRAGQLWLHLQDPELSSYTGAEKVDLSAKMLRAMKAVVDGSDPSSLFTRLYGNWSTGTTTWTGKEIVHAARKNTSRQDPSMGIFGVETSIVGAHPDAIFYDDPISRERLKTDVGWFKAVNDQVVSLDPVLQADGLLFLVGTRYGSEDHFGTCFSSDGVQSLTGMETDSIEVTPEGLWHVYFMCGKDQEGKPTTPQVWPALRMDRLQRSDAVFFATQVMNDPYISEDNPITKDQIMQCKVTLQDVPWAGISIAICCDTAFWKGTKIKSSKDSSVMVVHGFPKNGSGDVYILEVQGSQSWRAEDFAKRLIVTVQRYRNRGARVFAITDELYPSGGKAGSWSVLLKGKFNDMNEPMPPFYELNRFGTRKIDRIVNAANFWVDGHVRWVEGAPGIDLLLKQMAQIGQMKLNPNMHDDYADAHADAFHPQLYQPMRRLPKVSPYDVNSTKFIQEGFTEEDHKMFEVQDWENEVPRSPIR